MRILLVDNDKASRNYLKSFLRQTGHFVITAENGRDAFRIFKTQVIDLVMADIDIPGMSGIELIHKISDCNIKYPIDVLVYTEHGDLETAIESLRAGARDYLLKPIDIEVLADSLKRLEEKQLKRNRSYEYCGEAEEKVGSFSEPVIGENKEALTYIPGIGEIWAFSKSMQSKIVKAMKFYRDRDLPVLVLGETGTGKEVMARLIHYGYAKENRPFIDINCATLNPTLFESELFGYEAGAFTGGHTKGGKGKIDLAQGGTLFLDEIGEISIASQAKLLRLIQEKEYYRVGGLKKINADVRIICATNIDIQKMIEEGKFRKDLYYRLNVGQFVLPPLRERREEIIPLAEMFLAEFCCKRGKRPKHIGRQAEEILNNYAWPGNVRELRNLMEYIVFNYDEIEIEPKHLDLIARGEQKEPLRLGFGAFEVDCQKSYSEIRKMTDELIYDTLRYNHGNKAKTARNLGISRKTLYRHLNKVNTSNTEKVDKSDTH